MNKLIKQMFCKHCYELIKKEHIGYIGFPDLDYCYKNTYKCILCDKEICFETYEPRYTKKNLRKWGLITELC